MAKIKNIVPNIKAAFVDIGVSEMCYLPLSEGGFKNGDEIIVQISKDSVKTKQPTVTTKLTFTGRYVVLVKNEGGFSVSGKITQEEERNRLHALKDNMLCGNYRVILRTNCIGAAKEVIQAEFVTLQKICKKIEETGLSRTCFSLLYESPVPYLAYLRDIKEGTLDRIITDDEKVYTNIVEYITKHQVENTDILTFYKDKSYSLNHLLGIESKIKKVLQKKVWLNSGASLVIEPTEALTVIDVNTNKAIRGNRNPETTYFKVNMEAAKEVARQLRVRNLSGIIIVDFIDMKKKEHRGELLREFRKELGKDKIKTVLVDMTPLGLVEITRMKKKKPLYEQIAQLNEKTIDM